jgi:2,5-furandicarboxylate decarboxylase 1
MERAAWMVDLSARQDLHVFLEQYEKTYPDDVLRVDEPLDRDQEVTALVLELWRSGRAPVLICTNVRGVSAPVVTNMFGSRERIARLLDTSVGGLHRAFYAASRPIPVREHERGPVLGVSKEGADVDVGTLPMLRHFEQDRAEYLTSAIVIARDPRTGIGNASYHRCMVTSPTRLATSLHSRGHLWRYLAGAGEMGATLPVAVVVGGHPLFMLASAARVGLDVDEREIAGGLFGEPLDVVPTQEHGIGVPATADYVLEGTIDPNARSDEGPFGEYSGYASSRSTNNVIEVTRILRRVDPIFLDIVSGNAADHLNLGRVPRESEMAERLRDRFPDVLDIEYPSSGTHFHCFVSIGRSLPGQARQVALALLGWDPYLKLVVVVDDDIDVRREDEVLWAIATRFQAERDLIVMPRLPGSLLDPSSDSGVTSRMVIDATRSPGFEGERVTLSEAARSKARALIDRLGG